MLRALELAPNDVDILLRYAYFLENIRRKPDEAEKYYERAATVSPSAKSLYEYAYFLQNTRKQYDKGLSKLHRMFLIQ